MVDMGDRIKKLRTERGMTQPNLAERLNVTRSAIAAYENGSRLPSLDVLMKLSKQFNVTSDYLLGIDDGESVSLEGLADDDKVLVKEMIETLRIHESKHVSDFRTMGSTFYVEKKKR